jgi:hypothetical protein
MLIRPEDMEASVSDRPSGKASATAATPAATTAAAARRCSESRPCRSVTCASRSSYRAPVVTSFPKATGLASWLEQASMPAALRGSATDVAGYLVTLIFTVAVCPASTLTAAARPRHCSINARSTVPTGESATPMTR